MEHAAKLSALLAQGLLKDAAKLLEQQRELSLADRVLNTRLQSVLGDFSQARDAARDLLGRHLTGEQRAVCLEALARCLFRRGEFSEAIRHQREAIRIASRLSTSAEAAFRAQYCQWLLQWPELDAVAVELALLRKVAIRGGQPSGLIDCHLVAAELDTKRGAVLRADGHLASALSLLQSHHNYMQTARWAQVMANLASFRSDWDGAIRYATLSLENSEKAGWRNGVTGAVANLAYFRAVRGETSEPAELIRRFLEFESQAPGLYVAVLDTEMQLAIAAGDADRMSRAEVRIAEICGSARESTDYYRLWSEVSRARWLLDQDRGADALDIALKALPAGEAFNDRNLVRRLSLVAAESLAQTHHVDRAMSLFRAAAAADKRPGLELFAEWSRVAGLLTAADQRASASHFQRAARIFRSIDYALGLRCVERTAARCVPGWHEQLSSEPAVNGSDQPLENSPDRAIEAASALFQLAGHPLAAGRELLHVLSSTRAVTHAALVQTDSAGHRTRLARYSDSAADPEPESDPAVRMDLGSRDGHTFEVAAWARPAPASLLTVLAVERLVQSALALHQAGIREREAAALWPEDTPEQQLGMIFSSENMIELVNLTRRVAASHVTVLFTGESGTGKELFARALHEASPRREQPFIPFNCTAVAKDMLDSQLFGYRRGAFTGAQEAFQGVIRAAAGGTLLLDEIGELSLDVQPKLLRFLESGEVHPLGEPRPVTVDVRVVAATNANLEQLVADGRFREDLYYRLNVVQLHVPPLRERREEIPLLVQHFLDKFSRESPKTSLRFAEETMEFLVLYKWPGNVRQLANEVRRLVALAESGAVLMPEHLSHEIAASRRTIPASQRDVAPTEFVVRMDQPLSAATEHLERSMIQYALELAGGRVEEAAQLLGLSRKGLYLKRQRLLTPEPEPTASKKATSA